MRVARRVLFRGRVQGVGFRYAVRKLAESFDVTGWVRNREDGGVEMEVSGETAELNGYLRAILEESSVAHHVRSHLVESIPLPPEAGGFRILH